MRTGLPLLQRLSFPDFKCGTVHASDANPIHCSDRKCCPGAILRQSVLANAAALLITNAASALQYATSILSHHCRCRRRHRPERARPMIHSNRLTDDRRHSCTSPSLLLLLPYASVLQRRPVPSHQAGQRAVCVPAAAVSRPPGRAVGCGGPGYVRVRLMHGHSVTYRLMI